MSDSRFKLVFDKLEEEIEAGDYGHGIDEELSEERAGEMEEIGELRRLAAETAKPQKHFYSGT